MSGRSHVIYCGNGLGGSTREYWQQSLRCFYDRLILGGVLLLEHRNAMAIRGEVETLIDECGFASLGVTRQDSLAKKCLAIWPTG